MVHVDEATEFSQLEHEWRTSVTAIRAAAEILRDYDGLATFEHDRFVQAIIERAAGSAARSRTSPNFAEAGVFATTVISG